jgi:outer membrane receptor protein involved in Fe transport
VNKCAAVTLAACRTSESSAANRQPKSDKLPGLAQLLAVCLVLSAPAHARTELDRLLALSMEDLLTLKIRISTNTEQTLSSAPSVVSVITAEDIRATGATNLAEILQGVPGIYVRANLFAFRPQVTFRGAAGTHTLLMVNGEPIRDLVWSSGIFWKGLPASMIERVEIIRGPGTALFGSDASAGVINVITRTAGRIEQSEVGVRAGSFDTQAGWVRHGGSWNGFDIGFTAELSRTDGHDPFISTDGQAASGKAGFGWQGRDIRFSMAKQHWRLLADYTGHRNLETGMSGGGVLDPVTQARDNRFDGALLFNDESFSRDWGLNAELRYSHLDYSSGDGFQERPPSFVYPDGQLNRMQSSERGLRAEVSGLYTGIQKHAIRVGGGYGSKDLYQVEQRVNFGIGPDGNPLPAGGPLVDLSDTPYAFAPEKARQIGYLYLQDIWNLAPDWELTAGARYDHYSDFGGTLNPRLALVWQSSPRFTSKLMYGKAFRAPSYLELYAQTAATNPNPDLTPERSNTWDLSFNYAAAKDFKLGLVLYRFEQSNLIAANASTQFKFLNVGNRTSRGVELEAQWQAAKTLRLAGNLAHIDESDATFPKSVPRDKAYLRADWAFSPGWSWNLQANLIGKRSGVSAYQLVDTSLHCSARKDWNFSASIRNLFDADAREFSAPLPDSLPLPERSFYLEAKYAF